MLNENYYAQCCRSETINPRIKSSSFTCFCMDCNTGNTQEANNQRNDRIQILLNSEVVTDEYFNHSNDLNIFQPLPNKLDDHVSICTVASSNDRDVNTSRTCSNAKGRLNKTIRSISIDATDSGPSYMKSDKSKSTNFKAKVISHWLNSKQAAKTVNQCAQSSSNGQDSGADVSPKMENSFDALQVPSSKSTSCTSNSDQSRSPSPKFANKKKLFQRHLSWSKGHTYGSEKKPNVYRNNHHWGTFLNILADVVKFKKNKSGEWFQLGGHQGTFREGTRAGRVLKNFSENERDQFIAMQDDPISHITPKYCGVVTDSDSAMFIEIEDLLASFKNPSVMDCKMGVRTYLETELVASEQDPKPRKDLYDKMVSIDNQQPTEEEHKSQAIVKARYMIWRENLSSSALLGFRIEAIKKANDEARKEFQRSRTKDDVKKHIKYFTDNNVHTINKFLKRLRKIEGVLKESTFFATHELIGSSLLFIYDKDKAGIWLIDFAKTVPLPENIKITHNVRWTRDSHEDGYLIGLHNLVAIFEEIKGDIIASKSLKTNVVTYEF